MGKGRLEAFTDGVIAVVITIMVLELKPPHDSTWAALLQHWPVFLSSVLSFIYVGIYWNNHHHLMHAVEHIDGKVMWANLHFLFWLSLFPFTTSWLNESWFNAGQSAAIHLPPDPRIPTALYGFVLLMTAFPGFRLRAPWSHAMAAGKARSPRPSAGNGAIGKHLCRRSSISPPLCWQFSFP